MNSRAKPTLYAWVRMIETELKITLDAEGLARLQAASGAGRGCAGRRGGPRRWCRSTTTPPGTTSPAAGVALRLRRVGRRWVQTVKRRGRRRRRDGLFAHRETERPAPGGRLVLAGPDPEGALAAVREAAGGAPLAPVFETRVRRVSERLAAPGGGEVELALDEGEIVAGEASAPIREAELELVAGEVDAVYALARLLFASGPVRFASANKAARGYRLATTGEAEAPPGPRSAGAPAFDREATVGDGGPRRAARLSRRRSPPTWWWWRRAPRSRGRTSFGSGCAGCGRPSRCSGRASARPR